MTGPAIDDRYAVHGCVHDGAHGARGPRPDVPDTPLTWLTIGLPTMASLLVVSLRRQGGRSFTARCQWPRLHPLNERVAAVVHHPLIMVETTRQLARAVELHHLAVAGPPRPPLEPVSVRLGVHPRGRPTERGSATDVEARVVLSDLPSPRTGPPASCRVTAEFLLHGVAFASCTMRLTRPGCAAAARAEAVAPPRLSYPSAAAVGAAHDPDVLVARTPQGRLVIAPRDPGHPVLLPGRPARMPAPAVLEAARQAALLCSGMTSAAVTGLRVDLHAPVPPCGACVDVAGEVGGARFLVTDAGRTAAAGTVSLLRP
ncbi:AfsA-related hotdog domain-containing protein [Streptomyces cinereospinus]|uniref:AfsA-related hotdog domain-containing protein n=1 Tax=Streptomyces cinereospinus TaxID=285561 RepID=A0ABV5N7I2_9ACTN